MTRSNAENGPSSGWTNSGPRPGWEPPFQPAPCAAVGQARSERSVTASRLLMRPRAGRRSVGALDVAKAPADLGSSVGLPVGAGAGHLRARQRLRDAVGARARVRRADIPAALVVPQRVQARELAR